MSCFFVSGIFLWPSLVSFGDDVVIIAFGVFFFFYSVVGSSSALLCPLIFNQITSFILISQLLLLLIFFFLYIATPIFISTFTSLLSQWTFFELVFLLSLVHFTNLWPFWLKYLWPVRCKWNCWRCCFTRPRFLRCRENFWFRLERITKYQFFLKFSFSFL